MILGISLTFMGLREQALDYFFYNEPRAELYTRHYQYDFNLMQALLNESGFAHVKRCSYREGMIPDVDKLDLLPEQSLFVEACWPGGS